LHQSLSDQLAECAWGQEEFRAPGVHYQFISCGLYLALNAISVDLGPDSNVRRLSSIEGGPMPAFQPLHLESRMIPERVSHGDLDHGNAKGTIRDDILHPYSRYRFSVIVDWVSHAHRRTVEDELRGAHGPPLESEFEIHFSPLSR
jgi:hypothetical protein